MDALQTRFCPSGEPTFDIVRNFLRVPCVGEYIDLDMGGSSETFRVVDIHWFYDGPLIVAHSLDRPRAKNPWGQSSG